MQQQGGEPLTINMVDQVSLQEAGPGRQRWCRIRGASPGHSVRAHPSVGTFEEDDKGFTALQIITKWIMNSVHLDSVYKLSNSSFSPMRRATLLRLPYLETVTKWRFDLDVLQLNQQSIEGLVCL